jgi:putative PIN family toxin of toxin-antitoxin system
VLAGIVDTSVLVSSVLVPAGIPARVVQAWRDARYLLITSPPQIDELRHTLSYERLRRRYNFTDSHVDGLVNLLTRDALFVPGTESLPVTALRDPNDAYLLSMVLESRADFLVSSDKDLLVLREFSGTPILYPRQFLETCL